MRSGARPRSAPDSARVFGIGGQGAGLQLDQIVEPHRHAMHGADEGVAAAADHADAQASALPIAAVA